MGGREREGAGVSGEELDELEPWFSFVWISSSVETSVVFTGLVSESFVCLESQMEQ